MDNQHLEKRKHQSDEKNRPIPSFNPRSISRIYTDINTNMPPDYWDYESTHIEWHSQEPYEIISKVGRGKYSEVFSGLNMHKNQMVIIKVLKPVRSKKIKREIKILHILSGGPNIIGLIDLVIEPESKTPSFIFEFVENQDHRILFPKLTDLDVRYYIYQILIGLDYCHSKGIMHRDIKPHNIMIDHQTKQVRIIDWGLAEFYHPKVSYNARVASRYYKGPELLVDLLEYDYSLDLWSLGCMFAGMIFIKDTFFHGKDNNDQLVKIVQVLGTDPFFQYLSKYNLVLGNHYDALKKNHHPIIPWKSFVTMENKHLANSEAIDLLDHLLRYDHQERLTAKEAMQHVYFDPVRNLSCSDSYN